VFTIHHHSEHQGPVTEWRLAFRAGAPLQDMGSSSTTTQDAVPGILITTAIPLPSAGGRWLAPEQGRYRYLQE